MTDREINEAVARKLGWSHKIVPDYATSISAAWEVWEKMSEKYFLTLETEAGEFGRNIIKVWKNESTKNESGWVIEDVYADTAPLAICKAFLKLP